MQRRKDEVIEGKLRCEQLAKHLELTNSSKHVFLSEDASGIVKKIVHDSRSNQLIGLVLPLNNEGMPTLCSFRADTPEKIKELIEQPQATLVYIVVAKPLNKHGPEFILQIYGTNNKFKTSDVIKRWRSTEKELKK